MTIEEKAKAYDKALEKARQLCVYPTSKPFISDLQDLFPELRESEDEIVEKIRKDIISYLNNRQITSIGESSATEKWLAWLEKQNSNADNANKEYWRGYREGKQEIFDKYAELEKQGEQKPQGKTYTFEGKSVLEAINEEKVDNANKVVVEPKFKVGDWITDGEKVWKIGYIEDDMYIEHRGPISAGGFIESIDKHYHLWTIADVKDGDVLYHSDTASNGIFIFKELLKYEFGEKVICYCDYDSEDHFCLGEHHTCCWANDKILHPATKEQRDLLFQKMKEAGYEWDAEKKKLGKRVIDEGKAEMDYCFTKMMNGEKVSSAWSEEDEHRIKDIIYFLDTAKKHYASTVEIDACINWLNAIKTRCAWKPSDEQMASITCAVQKMRESACYDSELVSLFNDLNKLMESKL